RLETAVLKSPLPTTLVDLTKLQIKQTILQPGYRRLVYQWHDSFLARLEDDVYAYATSALSILRRPFTLQTTKAVSPMVKALIDETFQLPCRLREPYIRQWRRGLIKRATCLVKFIEVETSAILAKASSSTTSSPSIPHSTTPDVIPTNTSNNTNNTAPNTPGTSSVLSSSNTTYLQSNIVSPSHQQDIVQRMMDAVGITSWQDFLVILTTADKLRPGMVDFVDSYSNRF
ncbi:hypothetical protein BC941DRAFT_353048, partial [Chlamydoabsidia padenii]